MASSRKCGSVRSNEPARSLPRISRDSALDRAGIRIGPAQLDRRDRIAPGAVLGEPDGVQRRHRVAGADRAGVHARVGEGSVRDVAVLVADEAIGLDEPAGRTRPGPWHRAPRSGGSRSGRSRKSVFASSMPFT